ncbi:MAG TPA: hypothetical protein VG826_13470 [Pirellulales bacterium]|nr:hypothetical protein [Pirellulales bacterium]
MSTPISPDSRIPAWQFPLRLLWVVVQLLLVYWLGEIGSPFFYQGF